MGRSERQQGDVERVGAICKNKHAGVCNGCAWAIHAVKNAAGALKLS
jgi:hypothetical protein